MAVDVNAELLAELADETGGLRGSVSTLVGDVGSEDGVERLVAESVDRLGTLDVVVNVAGVLSFSHTHEQSLDEWNRLLAINLTGTFLVCRQALPHLLPTGGNIVNLASTAAHKGQPWAAAYAASKGGVLAFTRALAVEYAGAGLRVNSISPGAIDTPDHRCVPPSRGGRHQALEPGDPDRRLRHPRGDRRGHRLRRLRRGVPHERRRHPHRRRHGGLSPTARHSARRPFDPPAWPCSRAGVATQPRVDRPSVAHQSAVSLRPAIADLGISSS